MPAKSEKQRRWAFAVKGVKWAKRHHFDRVRKRRRKGRKTKGER